MRSLPMSERMRGPLRYTMTHRTLTDVDVFPKARESTMFQIEHDAIARTILFRINGTFSAEEVRAVGREYQRLTDKFRGERHMVLADLRGLRPLSPEAAEVFKGIIAYGRAHGTVCCAHLSDSSIVRLQGSRLAREVTPGDE